MTLKARYDPKEDRMRLELHPAADPIQVFWVTRAQWLALLQRLRAVTRQMGVESQAAQAVEQLRRRPPRDPMVDALPPARLDGIRLRAQGDGVGLILIAGDKTCAVELKASGLRQLEEMIAVQAERAGWDPQAALERLQAGAMASAAMQRAAGS